MADVGLTQEQIDATLGSSGEPGAAAALNVTALADFERDTMGNLPSVLNALTGFNYALTSVEFASVSGDEIAELIGSDLVFSAAITLDEPMTHCLVLDASFAKKVAAALTGGEVGDDTSLSEMEMSASPCSMKDRASL